jgi:hypothetical protein
MNVDTRSSAASKPNKIDLKAAKTPLVAALEMLFEQDDRWNSVPSPGGATLTRCWDDESADTLVILQPDTAYAWRENPSGNEIMRIKGTSEKIIIAVCEWPGPTAPDAPDGSSHIPSPSGAWT